MELLQNNAHVHVGRHDFAEVFLEFEDITLEECQPYLEFTSEDPVQQGTTLDFTSVRGVSRLASKPPCFLPQRSPRHQSAAAWFACCLPQCFIVSVSSSALNVSATAIDRDAGDHADLPLHPLAL